MPQGTNGILFGQIAVVLGVAFGGVWAGLAAYNQFKFLSAPLAGVSGSLLDENRQSALNA